VGTGVGSEEGVDVDGAGVEVERNSVAVVAQAITPITTTIKGKANSRGIFRLFPTVPMDGPKLYVVFATTRDGNLILL
jgi:hypothetical protein